MRILRYTLIKGATYLRVIGGLHDVRASLYVALSAAAIKVKNERFHMVFTTFAMLMETALILKSYRTVA